MQLEGHFAGEILPRLNFCLSKFANYYSIRMHCSQTAIHLRGFVYCLFFNGNQNFFRPRETGIVVPNKFTPSNRNSVIKSLIRFFAWFTWHGNYDRPFMIIPIHKIIKNSTLKTTPPL